MPVPTLVPGEETTSRKFRPPKQSIIIFDPQKGLHSSCLEGVLGNLIKIVWFDKFSQASLDRGKISIGVGENDLVSLNPLLFIVDLEILGDKGPKPWIAGIQMLENLRCIESFRILPPTMVISSSKALSGAHHNFGRLNVQRAFSWKGLCHYNSGESDRLVGIVRRQLQGI